MLKCKASAGLLSFEGLEGEFRALRYHPNTPDAQTITTAEELKSKLCRRDRWGGGKRGAAPGFVSGISGVAGDRWVPSTAENMRSPIGGLRSPSLTIMEGTLLPARRGVDSVLDRLFSASLFFGFFGGILSVKVKPR